MDRAGKVITKVTSAGPLYEIHSLFILTVQIPSERPSGKSHPFWHILARLADLSSFLQPQIAKNLT